MARVLAKKKTIAAMQDRLFLRHPPRYEFMKWREHDQPS
jgi:hypothetical protein